MLVCTKISDARFKEELMIAKRDFPFRLEEMEKEGELDLEFVRFRSAVHLFDLTKRAGEYMASNFDCGTAKEAVARFDALVDDFGRYVMAIVVSMRQRTSELDTDALVNDLETPVRRVVKKRRKRGKNGRK